MIIFPMQALPLVDKLMVELAAHCEYKKCFVGWKWDLTDSAYEALSTLLSLPSTPDNYSISLLATAVKEYDFDFSDDVSLV